ncbi:MAG: Flp family type IVb pilin [Caulobacterales bacterium]|jgi:pilus assembly protein Flp/PilA
MIKKFIKKFVKNESGATAIEYALIAGLIGVVMITAAGTLGTNVSTRMANIGSQVSSAAGGAAAR